MAAASLDDELELLQAMYSADELLVASDRAAVSLRLACASSSSALTLAVAIAPDGSFAPSLPKARLAAGGEAELAAALRRAAGGGERSLLFLIELCRVALDQAPPCAICLEGDGDGLGERLALASTCLHSFHAARCLFPWLWQCCEAARVAPDVAERSRGALQLLADRRNALRQARVAERALSKRAAPLEGSIAELARHAEIARVLAAAAGPSKGAAAATAAAAAAAAVAAEPHLCAALPPLAELQRALGAAQAELRPLRQERAAVVARVVRCADAAAAASDAAVAVGAVVPDDTEGGGGGDGDGDGDATAEDPDSYEARCGAGGGEGATDAPAMTPAEAEEAAAAAALAAVAAQQAMEAKAALQLAADAAAEAEAHLAFARRASRGALPCPVCRADVEFARDVERRYAPWLRHVHRARCEQARVAAQATAAIASAAPNDGAVAAALARGVTLPAELRLDDAGAAYARAFAEGWLKGIAAAAAKGGIVGIAAPPEPPAPERVPDPHAGDRAPDPPAPSARIAGGAAFQAQPAHSGGSGAGDGISVGSGTSGSGSGTGGGASGARGGRRPRGRR